MIAVHAGSGGLCGIGSIGGTINIRPALAAVSALLPLIRQRLGAAGHNGKGGGFALGHSLACRLGGDGGGIFHRTRYLIRSIEGTAIYNHLMATCIQAGVLADGQALALANGDVLLQGHIAVHGAALAIPNDASGAIRPAGCRLQFRSRACSVLRCYDVRSLDHSVAADLHISYCSGIIYIRKKMDSICFTTSLQTAALDLNGEARTTGLTCDQPDTRTAVLTPQRCNTCFFNHQISTVLGGHKYSYSITTETRHSQTAGATDVQ